MMHIEPLKNIEDDKTIHELCTLMEREMDSLYRKRPKKTLTGLRKRIKTLYWYFITKFELLNAYNK